MILHKLRDIISLFRTLPSTRREFGSRQSNILPSSKEYKCLHCQSSSVVSMAAYYHPHTHYNHYELPPPPPGAALHTPPPAAQPLRIPQYLPSQPQFVTYAPPPYPQSSHDDLRTLFIAGLPEDVKAREIYNLFREFPGYESSHLRTNASTQPFAFAVFVDQQSALMALNAVNGMVFDLEKGSKLYIDLAKSNPRSKRLRTAHEGQGSAKRIKSAAFSRSTDSVVEALKVQMTVTPKQMMDHAQLSLWLIWAQPVQSRS